MGIYEAARTKTQGLIEQVYWELYMEKQSPRITVRAIAERAGIHRATFYMYFDNTDAVMDTICERQLDYLREVCSMERKNLEDHMAYFHALEKLLYGNQQYLIPLVCEYGHTRFAIEYRQILKDRIRKDFGLPLFPKERSEYYIIDTILTSFVESIIQAPKNEQFPLKNIFHLIDCSMFNGVIDTLQTEFDITVDEEALIDLSML